MVLNTMYILITSHLVPLFWISPFNSRIIHCLPDVFIWLSESICYYRNRTSAIESPISNLFSPSPIISVNDTSIHLISYTCQHSLDPNYKPSLWVNNGHWLRSQGSPSSQMYKRQTRHRTIPTSQKKTSKRCPWNHRWGYHWSSRGRHFLRTQMKWCWARSCLPWV